MRKIFSTIVLALVAMAASAEDKHFDLQVTDVTSFSATVSATPDDNSQFYICKYVVKADWDEYGVDNIAELVKYDLDDLIMEYAVYGFEATYDMFCELGAGCDTITGLSPNSDYVAFCYYLDTETGMNTSPVEYVEFHTPEVTMSENKITMTYDAESNTVHIKTTNSDPYFFVVEKQSQYDMWQKDLEQKSLKAEVTELIGDLDAVGVAQFLYFTGDKDIKLDEFYTEYLDPYVDKMPDGKWIALCAGYAGEVNTDVQYVQFRIGEEVVQKDEKTVHFTDVEWVDNTYSQQWWEVSGYTADGSLGVIFSPTYATKVAGTYTTKDMYEDYTHLYVPATEQYIYFEDITIVVSITGENSTERINIKADGLAQDGILYHMTFDEIDPNPFNEGDGIETVDAEKVAARLQKVIKNGRVLIQKDGKMYGVDGKPTQAY